jgi:hypothetical protein
VADLVVELGVVDAVVGVVVAAVAAVAAVAGVVVAVGAVCDAPDDDAVAEDVDAGELVEARAEAVVPGISLDTTSPSTAAAPAATIAVALETQRTRARASSRRVAPGRPGGTFGRTGGPTFGALVGSVVMVGMSPCEPADPRRVG